MFKTKQRQAENAVAIPAAIPQTVINHAPSEVGRIVAKGLMGLGLSYAGWQFLLYLTEEGLGYRQPVRVLAWGLFGLLGLIVIVGCVYFGGTHFFALWTDYNLRLAEIHAETARSLALTAAQPRPGESRLTAEDSKFCALLRVVMDEAYRHVYREKDKVLQYTKGETKPWSRTPNQGRRIPGIEGEVSFAMAGNVRGWLTKEGVIRKDEINLERYPKFANFEALLEARFYTPVQVNGRGLSPALLRTEVSFTEN